MSICSMMLVLPFFFAGVNLPNAGNMAFRSNPRTLKLLDDWLTFGLGGSWRNPSARDSTDAGSSTLMHDQGGLQKLVDKSWSPCSENGTCAGGCVLENILHHSLGASRSFNDVLDLLGDKRLTKGFARWSFRCGGTW